MATVIKTPPLRAPVLPRLTVSCSNLRPSKSYCFSFKDKTVAASRFSRTCPLRFAGKPCFLRFAKVVAFSSQGETQTETETETETDADTEAYQEPEIEDLSDGAVAAEDGAIEAEDGSSSEKVSDADDAPPTSVILSSLQSYKEALAANDESKVAEIEGFLKSFEDEKTDTENKLAALTEELSVEKARILRISADFDNFRKRTERERLSLVTNAQGEVVESLLTVLDNFERAKAQIKVETEGEEKINNSYQSIYKQFMEILSSLGVVPVETIGKPFDPLLHEAIMREDSTEVGEDIIMEEYRKGFKLGDRLLRPSMVKVSAGPGPADPEPVESPEEEEKEEKEEETDIPSQTSSESTAEAESA